VQSAIQPLPGLVLLYQAGGLVLAAALRRPETPIPPQVATCGFFVETFG